MALLAKKDIDFTFLEELLAAEKYSPGILMAIPVQKLCKITYILKGHVMKMQQFSVLWSAKIEKKTRRHHHT